jgi:hippurate hydrolase
MIGRRVGLALALCVLAPPLQALDVPVAGAEVDRSLDRIYPELFALYRDIHAHPELGGQETRTATLLAAQMRALGFTVTEHVGGTGVVAVMRNGDGPTVLVRTEMDGLPMEEKTGLAYASRAQADYNGQPSFLAHSCGHDVHMASWVGTARTLVDMKDHWKGTVVFIAQPAEETLQGAAAMLADGLYERFPRPDYAFGLHTGPYAAGQVLYRAGPLTSNSDTVEITFKGRGGHGSAPHTAIDPVLIAARFLVDVQAVVAREKNPQQPGVITFGSIHGGTAGNIIPDEVELLGTVRSYAPEARAALLTGINRVARGSATMAGAPEPDIRRPRSADSVVNDPALTERTAAVFREAFGDSAIAKPDYITASEDYSRYALPGVHSLFFEIGIYDPARVAAAANGGEPLPFNHSPFYAPVPEPTIRTGVKAMSLAVLDVLGR